MGPLLQSLKPRLKLDPESAQGRRQAAPLLAGEVLVAARVDDLDADVVGAGGEVLADAAGDRFLVADRDDRLDQAVATAVGEVPLLEAA